MRFIERFLLSTPTLYVMAYIAEAIIMVLRVYAWVTKSTS